MEGEQGLSKEELQRLGHYFEEAVTFSKHVGAKVDELEVGKAVIYLDVPDLHLNGAGTLHGGVYASLIDNVMGISVLSLVGMRAATIQMNVHFLGAVTEGRITSHGRVVHRTRNTATAEGEVYNGDGELVAGDWGV